MWITKFDHFVPQKGNLVGARLPVQRVAQQENPSPKKLSKWEKPKEPPPPPVNRTADMERPAEIVPPLAITRNMVAKFREIQENVSSTTDESVAAGERKPIRKITPPRGDEVDRSAVFETEPTAQASDVVRCVDKVEDERPPPAITRSLLARFQSMENVSESTMTDLPQRRSVILLNDGMKAPFGGTASPATALPSGMTRGGGSFASMQAAITEVTDAGVFENEPVTNIDVVRESDRHDEEELPEEGFTRSLLAQWRTMETDGGATRESQNHTPKKSRSPSVTSSVRPPALSTASALSEQGRAAESHEASVEREEEEDGSAYLPPPEITKNMRAKFMNLEGENTSNQRPPKKVNCYLSKINFKMILSLKFLTIILVCIKTNLCKLSM